jgi:hypothetical protein
MRRDVVARVGREVHASVGTTVANKFSPICAATLAGFHHVVPLSKLFRLSSETLCNDFESENIVKDKTAGCAGKRRSEGVAIRAPTRAVFLCALDETLRFGTPR